MKRQLIKLLGVAALAMPLLIAVRPVLAQPIGGTISHLDQVSARTTDTYRIACRGGEQIRIQVRGDHDTDLDLYIYDASGNLLAWDDDLTDLCIVRFTPATMGEFIIRIVNRGWVYNEYLLTVE